MFKHTLLACALALFSFAAHAETSPNFDLAPAYTTQADAPRTCGYRRRCKSVTVRFEQRIYAASSDLLGEARKHIGKTHRAFGFHSRNWCADFVNYVRARSGASPVRSRAARAQLSGGRRVAARPGVIGVMPHHTGIVTRVAGGVVTMVSGNSGPRHKRHVRESNYSLRAFIGFIDPIRS